MKDDKTPRNWPEGVRYLKECDWSTAIPKDVKEFYCPRLWPVRNHPTTPSATKTVFRDHLSDVAKGPSRNVKITAIVEDGHPAQGQCGLVAASNLAPRQLLLDYIGCVHGPSTASTTSDYIICLDRYTDLSIDAEKAGNEARFINDFRGTGKKHNVEFEPYRCPKSGQIRMGVWVLNRKIMKGEELLVTYGKGFWQNRGLFDEKHFDSS
ncbi:hypothetical protein DFS34DRAFT_616325 [Phlyctochytrium arcticum]|nr:hypothetical protein DFS34DRAFT_616325 [Phlyctochytrium arcticum]